MQKLTKLFLLFCVVCFLTTAQAMAKSNKDVAPMHLDINAYNQLKRQYNTNTNEFTVQKDKDITVIYKEDTEYTIITTIKGVYRIIRVYYKPSGNLKSEEETFSDMYVNTAKYYDEQGNLTKEHQYTSAEWLDRVVKVAKEKLNVDLWSVKKTILMRGKRQERDVVTIVHNNGKDLKITIPGTERYTAVFDFNTLEIIEQR